jgi:hypothetical protein
MNKSDCRICFKNDVMTFPIINNIDRDNTNENRPISEIYEFCLGNPILSYEEFNLPNSMCMECINELFGAYKFIIKAKKSEEMIAIMFEDLKIIDVV